MASRRLATVLIGISFVVAGCSELTSGGPLDQPSDEGTVCAPVRDDPSITFGVEILENSSEQPVVIKSVQLADAEGMSMIEARVVVFEGFKVTGGTIVGIGSGYPPEHFDLLAESSLADGFELPPSKETDDIFNLVVGVRMDDETVNAMASGLDVSYESQRKRYSYLTTNSLELVRGICDFSH